MWVLGLIALVGVAALGYVATRQKPKSVEANEVESDEAKRALDIMGLSFTDSRTRRQPPEQFA